MKPKLVWFNIYEVIRERSMSLPSSSRRIEVTPTPHLRGQYDRYLEDNAEHPADETTGEILGYRYRIRREPEMKHYCGYLHGLSTEEADYLEENSGVHGGITSRGVEEDGTTLVGFDALHAMDFSPRVYETGMPQFHPKAIFRNYDYIYDQLALMVNELLEFHARAEADAVADADADAPSA